MTPQDELRWTRSQLRALAFSRTNGHWFTRAELEHYETLCRQERELLDLLARPLVSA